MSYRPVSKLSFLLKVIERIAPRRLLAHVDANSLADDHQRAYKKFHSCELALLSVQDFVMRAADRGEVTALVLLDLSAAFDTIDHALLVERLHSIGVTGEALA
jgi:hypothetical protein